MFILIIRYLDFYVTYNFNSVSCYNVVINLLHIIIKLIFRLFYVRRLKITMLIDNKINKQNIIVPQRVYNDNRRDIINYVSI